MFVGSLSNPRPPWHLGPEQFLSVRGQFFEQFQHVVSAGRSFLSFQAQPCLQCDLYRQRQQDWTRQELSLEKKRVQLRRLEPVPVQLLHNVLQ